MCITVLDNSGIIKLIEVQKNLNDVSFIGCYSSHKRKNDESFYKSLEEPLIKHANTIQYLKFDWIPITGFLSHLVNLSSLEICNRWNCINYLENLSSPNLQTLKVSQVPPKVLANLIKNSKEHLTEISVIDVNSKTLIQAIYLNCPDIKYLYLSLAKYNSFAVNKSIILEIERLLINCQFLNGLSINTYLEFSWDHLFKILVKSSPVSLFKFIFSSSGDIKLEDLKLFFDNWEDRDPMLLKINDFNYSFFERKQIEELIEQYIVKGTVEICYIYHIPIRHEKFEWA